MLTMQGVPKKITARAYFPVILHEVRVVIRTGETAEVVRAWSSLMLTSDRFLE
jgi:hypothetical protein